jgi:ubiquinone/menaquinone biosynthesis C-methylase UbiE
VAAAAARRPLTRCDLRALPFGAAVFDGIWACASLVHFDLVDISAVLVEFRRVAKTGSALFVTVKTGDDVGAWVPTEFGARWFHFWRPGTLVATIVAARFEVHSAVLDKDIWVDVFAHAV